MLHLASQSPRRRQLLEQIGVPFAVLDVEVAEQRAARESPHEYVSRVARDKARAGWASLGHAGDAVVLGADTEVVLGHSIFGKPRDAKDAAAMLERLSGRTHDVMTAVAVRWEDRTDVEVSVSRVTLRKLTRAEIDRYVASGEPLDKAGGYAIQGLAAAFITRLEGSYSGVMGLPLAETATLLGRAGVAIL